MITNETSLIDIESILRKYKLTVEGICVVNDVAFAVIVDNHGNMYRGRGPNIAKALEIAFETAGTL